MCVSRDLSGMSDMAKTNQVKCHLHKGFVGAVVIVPGIERLWGEGKKRGKEKSGERAKRERKREREREKKENIGLDFFFVRTYSFQCHRTRKSTRCSRGLWRREDRPEKAGYRGGGFRGRRPNEYYKWEEMI